MKPTMTSDKNRPGVPDPMLMRVPEAAAALAISPRLLWELTNRREIPSVRYGRMLRYDPDDLREWIEKNKKR